MVDGCLNDEKGRLLTLKRYAILDTPHEEAFNHIVDFIKVSFNVPIVSINLIDADRQWSKAWVGSNFSNVPRDLSFCTHTIKSREPLVIPDARLDERFKNNVFVVGFPHIISYLGVPLKSSDGYNIGTLCVVDTHPRTYSPDQVSMLQNLAEVVIDQFDWRLVDRFDEVTSAVSRRTFVSAIQREISRDKLIPYQRSLALFDVDHFSLINAEYGHDAGDLLLREISNNCLSSIDASAVYGRLGANKFGVLLADKSIVQAKSFFESLRLIFKQITILGLPSLKMTASFGITQIKNSHLHPEFWLQRAEIALNTAKQSGGDCCVLVDAYI